MTTKPKTHWDRPGHFIGSDRCRFGVTDVVNGHIVSTVGDYRMESGERHIIGHARFYETMVFKDSGKRCTKEGEVCSCGNLPQPESWSEVDFDGYMTEDEARAGHAAMVAKYAGPS